MSQIVPHTEKFILGSGDVRIGDTEASLVSMGAANGIKFEEKYEEIKMDIDNAGEQILGIKNHKATISGSFLEMDLAKLFAARGGVDLYTTIPGTLVSDASQVVASGAWEFNKFIQIANQNGNGSIIQIDATGHVDVSGSVDGPLVAGSDFEMVKDNAGKWGIIVKDSATVTTEAQILTITYDYTPAATKRLSSGGLKTISPKVVQVVHTASDGKTFTVTLYAAKNSEGMKIEFPSDNADKALEVPFTWTGKCDGTRTVGDQLYRMDDTRTY